MDMGSYCCGLLRQHVVASVRVSLLLMAEWHSRVWMGHVFFIHSAVDGRMGRFHLVIVVNNAAWALMHKSLCGIFPFLLCSHLEWHFWHIGWLYV